MGNEGTALVSVLLIGYVVFLLLKSETLKNKLPLVLVASGGISNLLDRFIYGCVRDFITVPFWPSFNLADGAITMGVLLYIIVVVRGKNNA